MTKDSFNITTKDLSDIKRTLPERTKGVDIFDFSDEQAQEDHSKLEASFNTQRITLMIGAIIVMLGMLVIRTMNIQVNQGQDYIGLAENNRQRTKIIKANRGVIYTKDEKQLVVNVPSFNVVAVKADLPKKQEEREKIATLLIEITGIEEEKLKEELIQQEQWYPTLLIEDITREQALQIETRQNELQGIEIEIDALRNYQDPEIYAHILGYNGNITAEERKEFPDYRLTDKIGKLGIEKIYESTLKGKDGAERYEVDSTNNINRFLGIEEPENGNNLHLTIDSRIQEFLQTQLELSLEEHQKEKAIAVAIDPRNGEVRALVNVPGYNNNIFTSEKSSETYQSYLEDERAPLINRAIAGEYSPGSTFKMVTGGGALSEGIISNTTSFESTGGLEVGAWFFPDWKQGGHGTVTIYDAIAESANTFFYMIGGGFEDFTGIGIKKIEEYARRFGLGERTGIDLTGERKGFLPTKEWKEKERGERWYIGNTYQSAIGQGDVLVTPLQIANYTATLANGGTLYKPHLVAIENNNEAIQTTQVIDKEDMQILQDAMRETVKRGSAKSLSEIPMDIGGKTGTAQVGGDKDPHAWFTSFAKTPTSEIALTILVENGGDGDKVAVPIAKKFYEWYVQENIQ